MSGGGGGSQEPEWLYPPGDVKRAMRERADLAIGEAERQHERGRSELQQHMVQRGLTGTTVPEQHEVELERAHQRQVRDIEARYQESAKTGAPFTQPQQDYMGQVLGMAGQIGGMYGASKLMGGSGGAAGGAGGAGVGLGTIGAGLGIAGAGYGVGSMGRRVWGGGTEGRWGGTAAGAATGAAIGTTVFPGIGTAAGAVIGGIAGRIGGGSWGF